MSEAPYEGPEQPAAGAPASGHPAVDAVLLQVERVAGEAPGNQIPAYQAAHRTLQETLASIDGD